MSINGAVLSIPIKETPGRLVRMVMRMTDSPNGRFVLQHFIRAFCIALARSLDPAGERQWRTGRAPLMLLGMLVTMRPSTWGLRGYFSTLGG